MAFFGRNDLPAWMVLLVVSLTPGLAAGDGASHGGPLRVEGTQLMNARGEPVQLRGMSSHGLHWYPQFTGLPSILETKRRGATIFRLAMYADSVEGGYGESPEAAAENTRLLLAGLENVLAADMYAIVDWHLLKDENPLPLLPKAAAFFQEVTARYPNHPAIVYEICNEPNGTATWDEIRAYAEAIIPVIRDVSPDAVILVGTPHWSGDVVAALASPLSLPNVMYTYHLYTGYTDYEYVDKLDRMRAAGLPVFVSEWGISTDKATGGLDLEEGAAFLEYMRRHRISWVNWSLSNKDEDYSALQPWVTTVSGWTDDDLTPSGKLIFPALAQE